MNKLTNKKTVVIVKDFLRNIDPNLSIMILDANARSAKEAAFSLNVEVGSIVKSILLKSINNNYYICLVSGDKTVSINKISELTKSSIVKPNADEVKNITGFSIGGVPPFAHKKIIPTYIDESLSRFESIYAAAGHPYCVFKITYDKLCTITKGSIEDIID